MKPISLWLGCDGDGSYVLYVGKPSWNGKLGWKQFMDSKTAHWVATIPSHYISRYFPELKLKRGECIKVQGILKERKR